MVGHVLELSRLVFPMSLCMLSYDLLRTPLDTVTDGPLPLSLTYPCPVL